MNKLRKLATASVIALCTLGTSAIAQEAPFDGGWSIDQDASSLNFVSVKKGSVMELSRFATIEGTIAEDGNVNLTIPLDSVDTSVDLRNVRMRFLFFETFAHPEATITAQITEDMLADLETLGTKTVTLPFSIALHGVEQDMSAEVLVSLISTNRVSVSSVAPIIMKVADFGLEGGIEKLQEAAEVVIVPATSVTFNFAFDRNGTAASSDGVPLAMARATTALEPEGALTLEACAGRFEILSRTNTIEFEKSSANLTDEAIPLLNSIVGITQQCPGMEITVAGHTDSFGPAEYNLALSQDRADAVVQYLVNAGADQSQFVARGFGEAFPVANNATADGRAKNRRISFSTDTIELASR